MTIKKPKIKESMNSTKKMKKRILAISIDVPAIPVKPKRPATNATIKNMSAHVNIKTPC
jgi:hypothetical protein